MTQYLQGLNYKKFGLLNMHVAAKKNTVSIFGRLKTVFRNCTEGCWAAGGNANPVVHHHSPHEMPSLHIVLYMNIHEYPMFSDPNLSLDLHNGWQKTQKNILIFGDRARLNKSQSIQWMEFLPVGAPAPWRCARLP